MKPALLILMAGVVAAGAGGAERCTIVEGDRILAGDLARALPVFAALDPDQFVAYTPVPGLQRVMSPGQLHRLARRHGLPDSPMAAVCFERATEVLAAQRVVAALRSALDAPEAKVELADFSRQPVPRGELEFRRAGLASPRNTRPDEPVLWRGVVRYGDRRSVSVWARVRIRASRRQVIALRDLAPGQPIQAQDLTEQQVEAFPAADPPITSIEQAAGSLPRRAIKAGQPLYAAFLKIPNDVDRGEMVSVEVTSGAARLWFEARAETAGRKGDPVYVRNPISGRRFTALVEGKGKVVVRVENHRRKL
jgi:flagella basal body P-ring formation protein FlgA